VSKKPVRIRLLFADEGAFHHQDLDVPSSVTEEYDRLIDGLREDPAVLKRVYLDLGRLAAAWVEEGS
jgi:hypothetical protein